MGAEMEASMEQKQDDMQELVTEIARALVDEPNAVIVDAVERDENTVLRLRVAPSDVGKVIGKQGRTARSMRTILGAVSMKHHHRYTWISSKKMAKRQMTRSSPPRRVHSTKAINDRSALANRACT